MRAASKCTVRLFVKQKPSCGHRLVNNTCEYLGNILNGSFTNNAFNKIFAESQSTFVSYSLKTTRREDSFPFSVELLCSISVGMAFLWIH